MAAGLTVEQRLERLEDVEAIRAVKSRYAKACDDGYHPDRLAELFVEAGTWHVEPFGRYEGREAIREFFRSVSGSIVWALHFMIDPAIELSEDGQSAVGTWYMLAPCTMAGIDDPSTNDAVIMTGNYRDTFVKVDGKWWIEHLTCTVHQISNLDRGWVQQPFRGG